MSYRRKVVIIAWGVHTDEAGPREGWPMRNLLGTLVLVVAIINAMASVSVDDWRAVTSVAIGLLVCFFGGYLWGRRSAMR